MSVERYCQKFVIKWDYSNMAARTTKKHGGKVEIQKKHIKIFETIYFHNSRATFPVKLPNNLTDPSVL